MGAEHRERTLDAHVPVHESIEAVVDADDAVSVRHGETHESAHRRVRAARRSTHVDDAEVVRELQP